MPSPGSGKKRIPCALPLREFVMRALHHLGADFETGFATSFKSFL